MATDIWSRLIDFARDAATFVLSSAMVVRNFRIGLLLRDVGCPHATAEIDKGGLGFYPGKFENIPFRSSGFPARIGPPPVGATVLTVCGSGILDFQLLR